MTASILYRTVLYIPAARARALDKARSLDVDAVIFDLEDAVAPSEKVEARATLAGELARGAYGHRQRIVRINGLDTEWGAYDARAVAAMDCDAILIPKVESAGMVAEVKAITGELPIWCMIETPRGVLNALEIADCPEVEGLVLGTNDLAKDIGCETGGDRAPMMTALQTVVLAARSSGITCIDGVYNAFRDEAGLGEECNQGRSMGMDGKTIVHPAQIDVTNQVFAPTEDELELAQRHISAFDAASARGEGVAVVDGRIVENLHAETARLVLARADAISERLSL